MCSNPKPGPDYLFPTAFLPPNYPFFPDPIMKFTATLRHFLCIALLSLPAAHGATVIPLNDFESGLGVWTAAGASSGLYIATTTLQIAGDTTTNFATGISGTNFTTGGTRAASIGKGGGTLTSSAFDVSGGGAGESITINLDFVLNEGTSTRRSYLEYSNNNGVSWFTIAMIQLGAGQTGFAASTNKVSYDGSVTFTEGSSTISRTGSLALPVSAPNGFYVGAAFSSTSKFRVINNSSAGADARLFVDNVEVLSSIPEPRAALLGGLGLLALLRRRR